jgi:hypothetical protein
VFYTGEDSRFALHAARSALRAEGIEDSPAVKTLADQHAAWQSRLPDEEAALWDWLLAQDGGTVTGLLSYCVACTVARHGAVVAADRGGLTASSPIKRMTGE